MGRNVEMGTCSVEGSRDEARDIYMVTVHELRERGEELYDQGIEVYRRLPVWQRAAAVCALAAMGVVGVVVLFYHETVLGLMVAFADWWRDMPGGWLVMFLLVVAVSFPPLIGYSALSSLYGMIYGCPGGWPGLTVATLAGSTASFVVFRRFFSGYAHRLATRNTKFAALSSTLEQDRFSLLWMIRLCPLPYSLSNGALSSIPSVTPLRFFLATLATSPKLMMHIFVGDRIARLGTEKDAASKIIDVVSVVLALGVGSLTAYLIYDRTMKRAAAMEAELALEDDQNDNDNNHPIRL